MAHEDDIEGLFLALSASHGDLAFGFHTLSFVAGRLRLPGFIFRCVGFLHLEL